uniref:Uncharacterized protein n=1 Tax=Streptomyces auratus AGR0001 TaxID=1160718 RepID=J1RDY8_9ACTN
MARREASSCGRYQGDEEFLIAGARAAALDDFGAYDGVLVADGKALAGGGGAVSSDVSGTYERARGGATEVDRARVAHVQGQVGRPVRQDTVGFAVPDGQQFTGRG